MPRSGSATLRGYGHYHRQLRARLLDQVDGQPCPRCGWPMHRDQRLELDHTDDRRDYLGLAHASCNHRAGAIKGNRLRGLRRKMQREIRAIAWDRVW